MSVWPLLDAHVHQVAQSQKPLFASGNSSQLGRELGFSVSGHFLTLKHQVAQS